MKTKEIVTMKIAGVFSTTPGPRFRDDGDFSGEEFREDILIPWLEKNENATSLKIDLNGAFGYLPSFLEEAFGGAVRKGDKFKKILEKTTFSYDRQYKIQEIKKYIASTKSTH